MIWSGAKKLNPTSPKGRRADTRTLSLRGGTFKIVGHSYGPFTYGLALPKKTGLAPAVLAALVVLVKNGTYQSILTKWGIENGAIPVSRMKINGATS